MKETKRSTIGFLTANINTGASRVLWPGILDAAERAGVNLISYPGGRLKALEHFESQRNVIFDLVNTEHLDGIVCWTSALAGVGTVTSQEIICFQRRYQDMPMVSLSAPIEDCPLVAIDGYFGMQSLVTHLVDDHNYKKIALIRGPEGHPYALERYHAFTDILKDKGLSLDPALVSPMVNWEEGAQAMQAFLDERGLVPGKDFQAVVTASDLLATGAVRVLIERGIRIPADVAIAGFNDSEEGRLVRPPLTSVSLPFYEQGQRAVETLLLTLAGEEVPDRVILDSQLLVRQSCGCSSRSINQAATEVKTAEAGEAKRVSQQAHNQLVEQILRVISNRNIAATWSKILIDAFNAAITSEESSHFLSVLDGMLKQGSLDGDETAAWQMAISVLRQNLILSPEQQVRAENLYGQARILIGEAIQHAQSIRQVEQRRQNRLLRDLGQELITTFDLEKLCEVLVDRLPDLGIHSFYLALYDSPEDALETATLKLALVDGKQLPIEEQGRSYPTIQLVPPELLPDRRYSFVVEPLYFQHEDIGYAVFEVGPGDGDIYEVLRGHISSALKGALLFQEADHARQLAEHANQIKTRLLANVSHELRTPLNIILGNTQRIQDTRPSDPEDNLELIHYNAEHLLRLINDLLDMSRAEINALDLYTELLDPIPLLEEAFAAFANDSDERNVSWHLDLPDTLPAIHADPLRLRQVLLNLLSNADKFTKRGEIRLGAESVPPHLHVWVTDTGPGISLEIVEKIYEPFFTHNTGDDRKAGIGLGLSITKHLVSLHEGIIRVDTAEDQGSTFHLYLPLPEGTKEISGASAPASSTLWLVSNQQTTPEEVLEFCQRRSLNIQHLEALDKLDALLAAGEPSIIAWDLTRKSSSEDWLLVRRLQNHPQLRQTPFILFQQRPDQDEEPGFTSLVVKPSTNQALWEFIQPSLPDKAAGTILIVDDDEHARKAAQAVVSEGLPDYQILTAMDGEAGLEIMLANPPDLVILDLIMPKMDGFDVLDAMRVNKATRSVPVIILSARQLSFEDIQRLEPHADVTLHSKEILSTEETIEALHNSLFGINNLPPHTSVLVKRSVAYIHQNFTHPISRLQIATAIGVSEDYLTRLFKQELGISPWDYLNRYRILEAKLLLRETHHSIGKVGQKVGFSDASYFNRVFRRISGMSPGAYREED